MSSLVPGQIWSPKWWS